MFKFRRITLDSYLLLAILLIAASLRLYNFSQLSLGNDELSVLARVQYDSFAELIDLGVKPDVHPAGIQVFAWFWTRIFGESELALRLPFLLAGLFSIFLLYKVGKKWFGVETALFASAALSCLQYSITLTVYARPYALVLCFVLAMTWFWHLYIFEQGGIWHLVGFALNASLCMYFHYFSFLIVGIISVAGVFLISVDKRKPYFLALMAIGILYLPHVGIFLEHLAMGGSGWIGKPEPDYLLSYLFYSFHFSGVLISFLAGLFLWSIIISVLTHFGKRAKRESSGPGKFHVLSLAFFSIPFVVGYLYSIYKAPVMHFGGLFFSFPFFLLFVFSFIPSLKQGLKTGLLLAFVCISIFSLIFERQHFRLFYNRSAEACVVRMLEHEKREGLEKTVYLFQFHDPYYADYYLKKYNEALPIVAYNLDALTDIAKLRSFLSARKEPFLSLAWLSRPLPPHVIPVIREYFPYVKQRDTYFISEQYIFSKNPQPGSQLLFRTKTDFESLEDSWTAEDKFEQDRVVWKGKFSGYLTENQQYGPTLYLNLDTLDIQPYNELWITAMVKLKSLDKDLQLVMQISREKGEDIWRSESVRRFSTNENDWNAVHYFVRLQHLELGPGPHQLKAYLWNPDHAEAWFDDLELRIEYGNPDLYALVEPICD